MRKLIILMAILSTCTAIRAQDTLWFTRTGHIYFISHTDIIDIDANNHQTASFLNTRSGEIAFTLLMKSFQFTLPLAEEHFNENYVESEKYPKATFKGTILDFDPGKLFSGEEYRVKVQGDLNIHGVSAQVKEGATLRFVRNTIKASSEFRIALDTYQIKVPAIVADRVATVIPIQVDLTYEPYKKGAGK